MSVRIRATVECERCLRKHDVNFHDPDADTDFVEIALIAAENDGWWRGKVSEIGWRDSDLCPDCAKKEGTTDGR